MENKIDIIKAEIICDEILTRFNIVSNKIVIFNTLKACVEDKDNFNYVNNIIHYLYSYDLISKTDIKLLMNFLGVRKTLTLSNSYETYKDKEIPIKVFSYLIDEMSKLIDNSKELDEFFNKEN